jgi:predicted glycosyltransferase
MDLKKNYDLIYSYTNEMEFFRCLSSNMKAGLRHEWEKKRKEFFKDKIDVAAFAEDFAGRFMGWKKESGA